LANFFFVLGNVHRIWSTPRRSFVCVPLFFFFFCLIFAPVLDRFLGEGRAPSVFAFLCGGSAEPSGSSCYWLGYFPGVKTSRFYVVQYRGMFFPHNSLGVGRTFPLNGRRTVFGFLRSKIPFFFWGQGFISSSPQMLFATCTFVRDYSSPLTFFVVEFFLLAIFFLAVFGLSLSSCSSFIFFFLISCLFFFFEMLSLGGPGNERLWRLCDPHSPSGPLGGDPDHSPPPPPPPPPPTPPPVFGPGRRLALMVVWPSRSGSGGSDPFCCFFFVLLFFLTGLKVLWSTCPQFPRVVVSVGLDRRGWLFQWLHCLFGCRFLVFSNLIDGLSFMRFSGP